MLFFSSLFQTKPPKKARKQDQKKAVNLQWNSRLFFQIGLIVSLAITTYIIENTYGVPPRSVGYNGPEIEIVEPPVMRYKVAPKILPKSVVPKEPKKVEKRKIVRSLTNFTATPNTDVRMETPTLSESDPEPVVPDVPVTTPPTATPSVPTNILAVEFAPVFPGCEGMVSKAAQTECLSQKIQAFIGKKFNAGKFSDRASGTKKIQCVFTIGADGSVQDIQARALDSELEAEAIRVLQKLPKMQPGKQGNTPVPVVYHIPILFQVQ